MPKVNAACVEIEAPQALIRHLASELERRIAARKSEAAPVMEAAE